MAPSEALQENIMMKLARAEHQRERENAGQRTASSTIKLGKGFLKMVCPGSEEPISEIRPGNQAIL